MSVALLVDLVIAVFVLEAVALAAWAVQRRRRRVVLLVPTLVAGAGLAIALRLVVHQASWTAIALALLVAGGAHAIDLRLRLRR